MAAFIAFDSKTMVNGETVISVLDGMGVFKKLAINILAENGINLPKEGEWYLQQNWLNAFKTISDKIGPVTLIAIGSTIPHNAKFPPLTNNIEEALRTIDIAYHMNHMIDKKVLFDYETGKILEGIGHYTVNKISDKEIHVVCENPYPCKFDFGLIQEVAEKNKPNFWETVFVEHDDYKPCREKGYDSCTYKVKWY